jgi:RimJ/RimL family protein N-acetyltransferase
MDPGIDPTNSDGSRDPSHPQAAWHHVRVSGQVELRPVRDSDIGTLEALTQDPDTTGEFQWFGWYDLRRWRRGWAENGLISPDGGTLMVVRDDESLGLVNWRRRPITPAASCWEIGVIMLPHARGRGYGTQAHQLLAQYLFATQRHTGSKPEQRWTTSPSSALSRRRDSAARASCARPAGATALGEMECSTAFCGRTRGLR